ncbi:glycosyltransferase family 9 protein [Aureliella helgolandensis]|uniref:ADP-heptose--LPS heptosyltransferase 2 n=1 Tax=Aureliella helgolandensis TaxID=2527968 RepID=A0A518G0R0_9BACT|nr:glycosyltransferase family 9 protein [Aureliella helgolandensis]QDV22104.1 ADP-heptose--LPS heptosyltransferase 2 [Aureliella helgolandensis]
MTTPTGLPSNSAKEQATAKSTSPQSKIGVLMPSWIGDACMATPALHALRQTFPDAELVGLMRPVIAEMLADGPTPFDQQILFEKKSRPGLATRWGLVPLVRQARLDTFVLLTNSFWSAMLAKLSGARRTVGYARDGRGWLLSEPVPAARDTHGYVRSSPVDCYLELVQRLGCEGSDRQMRLGISPADERSADSLWHLLDFDIGHPTLVINSNAATDDGRVWPASRVLELSQTVAEQLGWQVLLHCGRGERQVANDIAMRANHPRIGSMGAVDDLPLGLTKAVMRRAHMVVTTDSGPRHIATAMGRTVLTLYGTTTPDWTRTYNVPEIEIVAPDVPSSDTLTPRIHHLGVARVFGEIQRTSQRLKTAA